MKKFLKTLGIVLGLFVIYLAYLGIFKSIDVSEETAGPYHMIYIEYTGDYNKMGVAMDTMYEDFAAHKIVIGSGIGIYYDDPQTTPVEELRADIGILVAETEFSNIDGLSGEYLSKTISETNYARAIFPFKTKASFAVGVYKVYPIVAEYLSGNNYKYEVPRIEIYGMKDIVYLAEILEE